LQDLACVLRVLRADHDVVRPHAAQPVPSPGPAVGQAGQALDAGGTQDRAEQLGLGLATGDLDYDPVVHLGSQASKRGILAYITDAEVDDRQSAIDIVLRRFTEYHDLEAAFGRRAVTERAKGILMERHSVDDAAAFEMLRDQSRRTNTKLADVAAAVIDGHRLLPKQPDVSQTSGGGSQ
jgi:hypothetical protein